MRQKLFSNFSVVFMEWLEGDFQSNGTNDDDNDDLIALLKANTTRKRFCDVGN